MATLSALLQNFFAVFALLAFIAVVLFIEGAYYLWHTYKGPQARKIERRLRALSAGAEDGEDGALIRQRLLSEIPAVNRVLHGLPQVRRFDRFLEQSGLEISVARLFVVALLLALATDLAADLLALPPLAATPLALGALTLPFLFVQRRRRQRIAKIELQLADAIDLICRALRAGHAFAAGLQMVGEEMPEPIAGEFRIAQDEVNFGVSLQQALRNLAIRVPSTDLRYFVIAVLIQRETGGNLTEVLGNLAALIRDRLKLLAKVRVLATEGIFSAWILGLLPFAVAGLLNLIHPAFITLLWSDPLGRKMVGACALLMLMGGLWMRKIVRIHV